MLVQPVIQPIICIWGGGITFLNDATLIMKSQRMYTSLTLPLAKPDFLKEGGGGGQTKIEGGGGGVDTRLTNEVTSKHLSVGRDP